MIFLTTYFGLLLGSVLTEKIGCGNPYNTKNWDCDAFHHYFMPSNIAKTLYCIGFNKHQIFKGPITNESMIYIDRRMKSLEKLDEENNVVILKERLDLAFYDKHLDFRDDFNVSDCPYVDFPTSHFINMVPDEILKRVREFVHGNELSRLAVVPVNFGESSNF